MGYKHITLWHILMLDIITFIPCFSSSTTVATTSFINSTAGIEYQLGRSHNLPNAIACSFTNGECNWRQSLNDTFDWTRHSGSTSSTATGPSSDHTGASGYYMYIESSSPRRYGNYAILTSYTLHPRNNQNMCFSFWYNMYGGNIGSLEIYIKRYVDTQVRFERVWAYSLSINQKWHLGEVNIKPPGPLQILIKGTVGSGYEGDIAIDDLSLSVSRCVHDDPKAIVG